MGAVIVRITEETKATIRCSAINLTGCGVPEEGLALMLADHAIGLLENQQAEWFAERERTPEMVLLAMLRAYEAAALDATIAEWRYHHDKSFETTGEQARDAAWGVRWALAIVSVGGYEADSALVGCSNRVKADYKARLAGTRPLNAPPLEV